MTQKGWDSSYRIHSPPFFTRKDACSMKICLKFGVHLSIFAQRLRYPNNKAFLDIHDILKGLVRLMGRSPGVCSFSCFDYFEWWLERIKKCDFYAVVHVWLFWYCFENGGSTVISNFWEQIHVSTAMWSTKFPVILGAPYNRVFRWNFHFTHLS